MGRPVLAHLLSEVRVLTEPVSGEKCPLGEALTQMAAHNAQRRPAGRGAGGWKTCNDTLGPINY